MTDRFSKDTRSRIMSHIRGKDTGPELAVRRILWSRGLRYRIHDRTVLGTPDLSNKRRRLAVFVDGCFWHGCPVCYREPQTNKDFWQDKITRNRRRREVVRAGLEGQSFRVVEIWEHEIGDHDVVMRKVSVALGTSTASLNESEKMSDLRS